MTIRDLLDNFRNSIAVALSGPRSRAALLAHVRSWLKTLRKLEQELER